MDGPAVRLCDLTPDNTDVIGVNGTVSGRCGYGLPIVHYKPSNSYSVLSLSRKPAPVWNSERTAHPVDESIRFSIQEMEESGRFTRLPNPMSLPLELAHDVPQQPVVLWVDEQIKWTRLLHVLRNRDTPTVRLDSGHLAACVTKDDAESLLSHLSLSAQHAFDRLLRDSTPDWPLLVQQADVALQASRTPAARYWSYVRKAITYFYNSEELPERAYQLFQVAVAPVYQSATWDGFVEAMNVIHSAARARATVDLTHLPPPSGSGNPAAVSTRPALATAAAASK